MTPSCIICNEPASDPLYPGIVRCRACQHVYADRRLTDEELALLYKKDYFFGEEYSDYLADRSVLRRNFALRMRELAPFLDERRHRRVLEVGSAYGFFLELVRDRFESVTGFDISEDGVRHARSELHLDVTQGDLLHTDLKNRTFDLVCLWDTIEHLRDPHLYIRKIASHTATGALLALTTGDIGSLNARLARGSWRLIHPPTHLHYFSQGGLARLLNLAGFDVVSSRHCGFYRSVDLVDYNLLVLRYKTPRLYALLKAARMTKLNFYLNMFDILHVIARRR
jgi:SAM-dependent methyltransferase